MSNILNNLVINFSFLNLDFIFDKWNTIKNHDIILVGEATHGAKECIKFKSALFKFLVENASFHILALESNKCGTEKINRYINGEIKDIDNVIKALSFELWVFGFMIVLNSEI